MPAWLNRSASMSLAGFSEKTLKISGANAMASAVITPSATTAKLVIALTELSSPVCRCRVNRGTSVAVRIPPSNNS